MPKLDVVPCQATVIPAVSASFVEDARELVLGVLFTAAVAVIGTILFTAALVAGVVASPLLAAFGLYTVLRARRVERVDALDPVRPLA